MSTGKILCPVDLAHEASWKVALPEAVREARSRKAELHLLAIVPDFGSVLVAERFPRDFERDMLQHTMEDLKALAARAIPEDVAWHAHIGHGHPAEQILEAADRVDPELIVMASHKPDMLRTLLVGSVADKIAHNARQSVLIVRA